MLNDTTNQRLLSFFVLKPARIVQFFTSLQEYEADVDNYNSTLEDAGVTVPRKTPMLSLADGVQKKVKINK